MKFLLLNFGRLVALIVVFAAVAALSDRPALHTLPDGTGVLVLSFSHGADRKAACRPLTPEETKALPPNMRRTELCPRERPAIHVELDLDGERVFAAEIPPSGIAGDGPSRVRQRFVLPVGSHDVAVRLRDRPGTGFTWEARQELVIGPASNRVIDFRPESGGFIFH